MHKFKESGIGSQAWYLQTIKDHPDQKGITYLTTHRGISYYAAVAAVSSLVQQGYIKAVGKQDSKRFTYQLTSFGHRYLEEQKGGLTGSQADEVSPDSPLEPSQLSGKRQAIIDVAVPTAPKPAIVVPQEPGSAVGQPDQVLAPIATEGKSFREALVEILLEKFADQVSAKELMERMGGSDD